MVMEFRRAMGQDAPHMLEIIEDARAFLRRQGVDQWQNGYPSAAEIAGDMEEGNAYVLCLGGGVRAMAALQFTPEADYTVIHGGAWAHTGPYATVHRLAVDEAARGRGLGGVLLGHLQALCTKAGVPCLRTDTHRQNLPMQALLESFGFVRRGTIYLTGPADPGAERIAYEKVFLPPGEEAARGTGKA